MEFTYNTLPNCFPSDGHSTFLLPTNTNAAAMSNQRARFLVSLGSYALEKDPWGHGE